MEKRWSFIFAGIAVIPGAPIGASLDNALNVALATGEAIRKKEKGYSRASLLRDRERDQRPSHSPELNHLNSILSYGPSVIGSVFL